MMKLSPNVSVSAKKLNALKFPDEQFKIGVDSGVSSRDFTELSNNVRIIGDVIKVSTVKVLALSLVQILAAAQPRVPFETGQLRESGNARILLGKARGIVVARGTKQGTVQAMINKVNTQRVKAAKTVDAVIEYNRISDDGMLDIALWTHENLNPHGGISPAARQLGTGPKYLEIAWNENKNSFISNLQDAVAGIGLTRNIKKVTAHTRKNKGKYTVDQVILSRDRVDTLGYFG